MNLVDSSAWIEYLFAEPNAAYFTKPIERTKDLLVPVICLYEVFKKIHSVADEARSLQAVAQMEQGQVVDVTKETALSAASISLEHKLPMADSLIYAIGKAYGATIWTQDEDFKGLPNVRYKKKQIIKATAPRKTGGR